MSMRRLTGRDRRIKQVVSGYAASDPRAYGTPVWWHDPGVASTLTVDGSNRVSSMLDLGTGGVNVTNAGAVGTWPTRVSAHLNGYDTLLFTNQTLNKALGAALLGTDWTIFVVLSNRSSGGINGSVLRQGSVGSNTGVDLTFVSNIRTVTCKGVQIHSSTGSMTNDTYEVWEVSRVNGAAPTLKINGVTDPLSGAATGYSTTADTLNYGVSVNSVRIAFCCAFNATGISSAFGAALKTKYGL